MAAFIADSNRWYAISRYFVLKTGEPTPINVSMTPGRQDASNTQSTVWFSPGDTPIDPTQFNFQLYPITNPPNGSYLIRQQQIPTGFLRGTHNYGDVTNCTDAVPPIDCTNGARLNPSIDFGSVWTFEGVGDGSGSFYMYNAQNGSSWRIDLWPNGSWLRLASNVDGTHETEQMSIRDVGPIDNATFQSIPASLIRIPDANSTFPNVTGVMLITPTTNTTSPSTTTTSSSPSPTHHGLSTGTTAGIGAGVGVAGVVAALALLWWFLRGRKARAQAAYQPAASGQVSPLAMDDIAASKAGLYSDDLGKAGATVEVGVPLSEAHSEAAHEVSADSQRHEMLAERDRAEAPGDERQRYELPG